MGHLERGKVANNRIIASNARQPGTGLSEHFADLSREVLQSKGFLQESSAVLDRPVADDGIFGVTGEEQNLHAWPALNELLYHFPATHARHDNVGDHQVDFSFVARCGDNPSLAIFAFDHLVAFRDKSIAYELSHRLFIFHQQNRLAPAERGIGHRRRMRLGRSFRQRQVDMKGGAPAKFTLHHYVSPGLLYNAVHRGEAKSRTLALFLRGKERLENS